MLLPFRRADPRQISQSRKKSRMLSAKLSSPPARNTSETPLTPALEALLQNRVLRFRRLARKNTTAAHAVLAIADNVLRVFGA